MFLENEVFWIQSIVSFGADMDILRWTPVISFVIRLKNSIVCIRDYEMSLMELIQQNVENLRWVLNISRQISDHATQFIRFVT